MTFAPQNLLLHDRRLRVRCLSTCLAHRTHHTQAVAVRSIQVPLQLQQIRRINSKHVLILKPPNMVPVHLDLVFALRRRNLCPSSRRGGFPTYRHAEEFDHRCLGASGLIKLVHRETPIDELDTLFAGQEDHRGRFMRNEPVYMLGKLNAELECDHAAHGCAEDGCLLEAEMPDDSEDVACGLGWVHCLVQFRAGGRECRCCMAAAVICDNCIFAGRGEKREDGVESGAMAVAAGNEEEQVGTGACTGYVEDTVFGCYRGPLELGRW